jgi:hypothetical protein
MYLILWFAVLKWTLRELLSCVLFQQPSNICTETSRVVKPADDCCGNVVFIEKLQVEQHQCVWRTDGHRWEIRKIKRKTTATYRISGRFPTSSLMMPPSNDLVTASTEDTEVNKKCRLALEGKKDTIVSQIVRSPVLPFPRNKWN